MSSNANLNSFLLRSAAAATRQPANCTSHQIKKKEREKVRTWTELHSSIVEGVDFSARSTHLAAVEYLIIIDFQLSSYSLFFPFKKRKRDHHERFMAAVSQSERKREEKERNGARFGLSRKHFSPSSASSSSVGVCVRQSRPFPPPLS